MSSAHLRFWPRNLPHTLSLPQTSLYYNLEVSAARHPSRDAIVFYDSRVTYAQLQREAEALAGFLQQRCGVKRGDRVLLYMQNSPQFIIGYYAILRADAVVVPVNPMNRAEELRHYLADSEASAILCAGELYGFVEAARPGSALAHVVVATYSDYLTAPTGLTVPDFVRAPRACHPGATPWHEALASGCTPGPHSAGPDDLCVLPYTSGTTGHPKGCMHTHRSAMHTTVAAAAWYQSQHSAVSLTVLPLFHVTGMQGGMNGPIYNAGTMVVLPRWDRDAAGELITRYKVTHWTNIPTMVIDFLSNPELGRYDLSSLQRVGGGGAAMPEPIAGKLKALCGLDYIEGYGLSETIAPTHINPIERPKRQCLGIPICDTESLVVDPQTLVELAPGEVGEIVTHGPQLFQGYWRNPQATSEAFVEIDGKRFFRTGDLGHTDEDGYFFITDRLKRMINASGFKVWPAEVEAMLYGHPDVQEACIIGTHDPYRGEAVKAMVVLQAGARGRLSADDLIAWSKERMAAYKYPRVVEFVDQLPKSATGKLMWRQLQERENEQACRARGA